MLAVGFIFRSNFQLPQTKTRNIWTWTFFSFRFFCFFAKNTHTHDDTLFWFSFLYFFRLILCFWNLLWKQKFAHNVSLWIGWKFIFIKNTIWRFGWVTRTAINTSWRSCYLRVRVAVCFFFSFLLFCCENIFVVCGFEK